MEKYPSSIPEKAWEIVNRIGNIGNRPDIRAVKVDQVQAICELAAQVRAEALEEAAKAADWTSDCELRCMNDCKLRIADEIRGMLK